MVLPEWRSAGARVPRDNAGAVDGVAGPDGRVHGLVVAHSDLSRFCV